MTDGAPRKTQSIVSFLPVEPGLRAHVRRVSALAARALRASGGTSEDVELMELAGLLHHYQPAEDASGTAKLLTDLGVSAPGAFRPLPKRAQEAVAAAQSGALAEFLESANLFDEQFENLPYEDVDTAVALDDLIASGVLNRAFLDGLRACRVTSHVKLLAAGLSIAVGPGASHWVPAAGQEALFAHARETAQAAAGLAREIPTVDQHDAEVAGLFHDIGRLPFATSGPREALLDWERHGFPPIYAEFLVSGTDHAAVGADLLKQWGSSPVVVDAVRFHHRLELTDSRLAAVIYAVEDCEEDLPSCARDHQAVKRLEVTELRHRNAAG